MTGTRASSIVTGATLGASPAEAEHDWATACLRLRCTRVRARLSADTGRVRKRLMRLNLVLRGVLSSTALVDLISGFADARARPNNYNASYPQAQRRKIPNTMNVKRSAGGYGILGALARWNSQAR